MSDKLSMKKALLDSVGCDDRLTKFYFWVQGNSVSYASIAITYAFSWMLALLMNPLRSSSYCTLGQ
jgi:hypothetical protein